MRNWRDHRRYIGWVSFAIFMIALLISLAFLVMFPYELNRPGVNTFPLENLSDMSTAMLGLNAFVVTILVAVITSIYSQSTQQIMTGFNIFRTALSDFKNLPIKVNALSSVPETSRKEWCEAIETLITRMDRVTLYCEGFPSDTKLENEMITYVEKSNRLADSFRVALDNKQLIALTEISNTADARQREMQIGLVMMGIGVIGERFVRSLLGVFISAFLMLMLSVIVRITSSMDTASLFSTPGFLNLFLYILMPLGSLTSFAFFLCASYYWWFGIQRHKVWGQPKRDGCAKR